MSWQFQADEDETSAKSRSGADVYCGSIINKSAWQASQVQLIESLTHDSIPSKE